MVCWRESHQITRCFWLYCITASETHKMVQYCEEFTEGGKKSSWPSWAQLSSLTGKERSTMHQGDSYILAAQEDKEIFFTSSIVSIFLLHHHTVRLFDIITYNDDNRSSDFMGKFKNTCMGLPSLVFDGRIRYYWNFLPYGFERC